MMMMTMMIEERCGGLRGYMVDDDDVRFMRVSLMVMKEDETRKEKDDPAGSRFTGGFNAISPRQRVAAKPQSPSPCIIARIQKRIEIKIVEEIAVASAIESIEC